jgi:peptidoglycan/LPS O-acetylase OafA/YrhL
LYANTKRLFNTNPPKGDHLSCLDGIRFLSISWVMLGHILSGTMDVFPTSNISSLDISQRFEAQAVLNAFVSVDTFFLMSGCLISYLMLKELEKTKGRINFLVMYIHRYLRYVMSDLKMPGQTAVLYHYCGLSRFIESDVTIEYFQLNRNHL